MSTLPTFLDKWLLQIVSTFFPMLLFQSFFRKKFGSINTQRVILTILCGLSIFICMAFPVSINQGYILDFRFIPLLIGYLYGGYRSGIILTLFLVLYRYYIGGIGVLLGGLLLPILFLIIFTFVRKPYTNWTDKRKTVFSYGMLTISLFIFAAGTQIFDDYNFSKQEIILWSSFCLLNYLTFWGVRYLQTSLKEMEHMYEKMLKFEKQHAISHLFTYLSQEMVPSINKMKDSLTKITKDPLTDNQTYYVHGLLQHLNQLERSQDYYLSFLEHVPEQDGKHINLNEELQKVINIIKPFSDHYQVHLSFLSTLGEDVIIRGNTSMVRFALLNIIKNAIEASKPNSQVHISLHDLIERVYIVVEDYGMGIPPEILSNLGKTFISNKENGSGLGLASVFKIIEALGGKIEIDSKINHGTTFSLFFPKVGLK